MGDVGAGLVLIDAATRPNVESMLGLLIVDGGGLVILLLR